MTPTNPDRSTPAHRVALVALARLHRRRHRRGRGHDLPRRGRRCSHHDRGRHASRSCFRTASCWLDSERQQGRRGRRAGPGGPGPPIPRGRCGRRGRASGRRGRRRGRSRPRRGRAGRRPRRSSMGGGWAALRRCESGGDYGAVSANGSLPRRLPVLPIDLELRRRPFATAPGRRRPGGGVARRPGRDGAGAVQLVGFAAPGRTAVEHL